MSKNVEAIQSLGIIGAKLLEVETHRLLNRAITQSLTVFILSTVRITNISKLWSCNFVAYSTSPLRHFVTFITLMNSTNTTNRLW